MIDSLKPTRDWRRGCACAALGVDIVYPLWQPHFIIGFSTVYLYRGEYYVVFICKRTLGELTFRQTRSMVRVEAILSQLIFEHALRIRVKAETSDVEVPPSQGSSEPGGSGQPSKDSPSTAKSPAKNLIGKLNNLVTSDLATATDGRDFLVLGQHFPSIIDSYY